MIKKALIETRTMKKEIRALKKMVASMKMSEDNSDTDDDLSDGDLSDDDSEDEVAPEPIQLTQNSILYRYQNLKNYMVRRDRSLGSIVCFQPDKHSLLDNFLNIKYQRLALAHPKTDSFQDCEEFCDALR
jgi:hypothetical protein